MNSNFQVIKKLQRGQVVSEIWEISSQGKSEFQKIISRWEAPSGLEFRQIIIGRNMNNIWATMWHQRNHASMVCCLRANGKDQEVIDFRIPDFPVGNHSVSSWYQLFRCGGDGSSFLYLMKITNYRGMKLADTYVEVIEFNELGYHYEKQTLLQNIDLNDWEKSTPLEDFQWKEMITREQTFPVPGQKVTPVFECSLRDFPKATITIYWNSSEEKFTYNRDLIEQKPFAIEIPGGIITSRYGHHDNVNKYNFTWPNSASEFGNDTKTIFSITPFGKDTPKPRFPRSLEQLKFEENITWKIEELESRLTEIEGTVWDTQ